LTEPHKFGVRRPVVSAHVDVACLSCQACCCVLKRGRLKGDWRRKSRPNLRLFNPVK